MAPVLILSLVSRHYSKLPSPTDNVRLNSEREPMDKASRRNLVLLLKNGAHLRYLLTVLTS